MVDRDVISRVKRVVGTGGIQLMLASCVEVIACDVFSSVGRVASAGPAY